MKILNLILSIVLVTGFCSTKIYGQYPYSVKEAKTFFQYVNLDYPGLETVRELVHTGAYEKAITEYIDFFTNRKDRRFMYDGQDRKATIRDLRKLYPEYEKELMERVSKTTRFRLDIEGVIYEWPDGDIHWRTEHKQWISVLNRMQYMPELGLAYWYTGEARYFDNFWHWFSDWYQDNPVPEYPVKLTGGTWEPALQSYTGPGGAWLALNTGIRAGSLISAYYYFNRTPEFSTEKKWKFLCSLMEHERFIYEYLKRGALGNWEMMVSTGFLPVAVMTPEWKMSSDILSFSKFTLGNNYLKSVNDEGFQFELTLGYHRHIVPGGIRALYLLKDLNGLEGFAPEVEKRILKSFQLVADLIKPNNDDPSMGDTEIRKPNDGPDEIHYDPFFSSATLLFDDPRFKSMAGNFSVDDYLFFGKRGYDRFLAKKSELVDTLRSLFLPQSRFVVMRSGRAFMDSTYNSIYCLFDNAPDGVGAHSHHDFLNIELFAYDKTLLIDPGRGNSYDHPLFWSYYRTVKGHNGVQIGEKSNLQLRKKAGSDLVTNQGWASTPCFDYAKGILRDYDGCDHVRELFFVKGEYFFLRDHITGVGEKSVQQYFHVPPGPVAIDPKQRTAMTHHPRHANLAILSADTTGLQIKLDTGYMATGSDNREVPIVTCLKKQTLPISFTTILYPIKVSDHYPEFRLSEIPILPGEDSSGQGFRFFHIRNGAKEDCFYTGNGSFEDRTCLKGEIAFCRKIDGDFALLILYGEKVEQDNYSITAPKHSVSYLRQNNFQYECYTEIPGTQFRIKYKGKTPQHLTLDGAEYPFSVDKRRKELTFTAPKAGMYRLSCQNPTNIQYQPLP